eukprot:scaffold12163_cov111-Isochrysis_galbana.AAC.2
MHALHAPSHKSADTSSTPVFIFRSVPDEPLGQISRSGARDIWKLEIGRSSQHHATQPRRIRTSRRAPAVGLRI